MKKIFLLMGILLFYTISYAQNFILVRFSSDDNVPKVIASSDKKTYTLIFTDPGITQLFSGYEVTRFTKEYPSAHLVTHPMAPRLNRVYHIETRTGVDELFKKLSESKSGIFEIPAEIQSPPQLLYVPNDYNNTYDYPGYGNAKRQLDFINATEAYDVTHGSSSILIGIVDVPTVLTTHEDIAPKINLNTVGTWNAGVFEAFHATMVASHAAGATDNGLGLSSIGFNSMLNFYDYSNGYNNILQAAIDGCKIINNSWAGLGFSQNNQDIINMTYDVFRPVIVAGAGNGTDNDQLFYPAAMKHVISVTAVGYMPRTGTTNPALMVNWADCHDMWPYIPSTQVCPPCPSSTFNHSDSVDLCAPGYVVFGAYAPGGNSSYSYNYGTSFSSPMVAGLAALILAINPSLTPEDVELIMKSTAADVFEQPENLQYLNKLGSGRIDAGKAARRAQTWMQGTYTVPPAKPTDIKWFEVNSDGVNTAQVESTCAAGSTSMCNIGYRLEVVASDPGQTFKWLIFYEENGVNVSKSIKYGNSILLTRGVDYPVINNANGKLRICVRGNDVLPGLYYYEERASSCFGLGCSYPCPADIIITGAVSTALTESATWVKSSGQTTTSATTSVKVDANPVSGYVLLQPASTSDFFVAAPSSSAGVFIAQGYNGCVNGEPSKNAGHVPNPPGEQLTNQQFSVFPNPGNGLFTVKHPKEVTRIEVLDVFGNNRLTVETNGSVQTKINLTKMASGTYFLRTNGVKYLTKIIKQ